MQPLSSQFYSQADFIELDDILCHKIYWGFSSRSEQGQSDKKMPSQWKKVTAIGFDSGQTRTFLQSSYSMSSKGKEGQAGNFPEGTIRVLVSPVSIKPSDFVSEAVIRWRDAYYSPKLSSVCAAGDSNPIYYEFLCTPIGDELVESAFSGLDVMPVPAPLAVPVAEPRSDLDNDLDFEGISRTSITQPEIVPVTANPGLESGLDPDSETDSNRSWEDWG
jgi:hypothetical protein